MTKPGPTWDVCHGRLQPNAIVTDEVCAACDFNKPGKTCLRNLEWVWRGETFACTSGEYFSLKAQLQSEVRLARLLICKVLAKPGRALNTPSLPCNARLICNVSPELQVISMWVPSAGSLGLIPEDLQICRLRVSLNSC